MTAAQRKQIQKLLLDLQAELLGRGAKKVEPNRTSEAVSKRGPRVSAYTPVLSRRGGRWVPWLERARSARSQARWRKRRDA